MHILTVVMILFTILSSLVQLFMFLSEIMVSTDGIVGIDGTVLTDLIVSIALTVSIASIDLVAATFMQLTTFIALDSVDLVAIASTTHTAHLHTGVVVQLLLAM